MKKFGVLMILLFLMVPATMATTVTISPTKIDPGDTVIVDVKSLPDGAKFSLRISAEFDVNPDERFAFTAHDLIFPFSLSSGEVDAYTKGTIWTELSVKRGETSLSLIGSADENGEYRTTQNYNISSGTYEAIALKGGSTSTADTIIAEMTMTGKKKGPDDGTISFTHDGIERGTVTITVDVDEREASSQRIAIGWIPGPMETVTPGPAETESSTPGDNSSPSNSSGSIGPGGTSGAPIQSDIPAPTTPADGKPSLAGADTRDVEIRALTVEGTLPAGWTTAGRAYAVTPADRALDAVLSFPAPDAVATIARLENGTWVIIPSVIDGDRITAGITEGGSYAVLVPAGVPTQTVIPATTTAPPAATTTPAATPLPALLPALACAILILVQSRRG